MKKKILSPVASVVMSLSLAFGILVADLTSSAVVPAAAAQTAGYNGGAGIISDAVLVGNQITAQGVLVNGVPTDGVFAGSVRIVQGAVYNGDVPAERGVIISGDVVPPEKGVIISGDIAPPDTLLGDDSLLAAGTSSSKDGVIISGDVAPSLTGVIISGDIRQAGMTQVIGGVVEGDNVQVINGVISGSNLRVVGAVVRVAPAGTYEME